jgi:ribosomal protein S12 methylthiotransferase
MTPMPSPPRAISSLRVGMVSLGCAKNLIDAEIMLGHLKQAGMGITPDASEADVLIVNTCSFIDPAKEESIEAILEAHQARGLRKRLGGQKLIVAGCMAQRFSTELGQSIPEVDAFIGLDQLTEIVPIIEKVMGGNGQANFVTEKPKYIPDYDTPRFRLTPGHFAYVKIAEGCNHPCSFCVIPKMRGRHRSRTVSSVVEEAKKLVAEGVRELNLISQDTTYFGMDRWEGPVRPTSPAESVRGDSLNTLLRELQQVDGDFWVRLLYTHPAHWSDELIETIAACPKVARYVDMPLQHISDPMLEAMRRETNGATIRGLVRRIREGIPGIALRTTFIVGFPGETEENFEELLEFIEVTEFERMGVFQYSREEGTRADKLPGHVPAKVKEARHHRAMALQKKVAARVGAKFVGRSMRVLVEKPGIARSYADAPEIDGRVLTPNTLPVGEFADINITGVRDYDLIGDAGSA